MKKSLLIIVLLSIGIASFGQNIKKAFKYYSTGEYDRAKVIFDEAIQNEEMASLGYFGIAKIFSNPKYRSHEDFIAYQNIELSLAKYNNLNASILKKVSDYFNGKSDILQLRKAVDLRLKKMVMETNTISMSEKFLDKIKTSAYYGEVQKFYASQRFEQCLQYNSIKSYQDYIKEFPKAPEAAKAQSFIYKLAYEAVQQQDDLEGYKNFLIQYPNSPEKAEVAQKILQKEYELALSTGSDDAFERFIQKYPNSDQAQILKDKQQQIFYIRAKQANSLEVYNRFLRKFPNSVFKAEISEIRDSLAYAKALSLNTEEAYKHFINAYPHAKQVAKVMSLQKDLGYSKLELKKIKEKDNFASNYIQKVVVYQMMSNDTTKQFLSQEIFYDKFGNITQEKGLDELKKSYNHTYTYSENGQRLMKEEKTIAGQLAYSKMYFYNNSDLVDSILLKCNNTCRNGLKPGEYHISMRYNNDRNLIEKVCKNADASYIEKHSFFINNQKLPAQELIETLEDGKIANLKINYQYDFFGNLIQKSSFSGENTISAVDTYFYNKNGKVSKFSSYDALGKIRKAFQYNEYNLIKRVEVEYPNDALSNHVLKYNYIRSQED